ncbi:class I SAM-dependent methyltransferase [Synechococcus sp. RSCCF101]|nr:class I SAM-dependent methyltransferase [Synechococcus sp. RSCCF101]
MDPTALLVDLYRGQERLGPGGVEESRLALELSGILRATAQPLQVADIGCGTGASTLLLARLLNAQITAVDLMPPFLRELEQRAEARGLRERITTLCGSMDALEIEAGTLDLIWSEGALYSVGFSRAVAALRPCLRPGGVLVASELSWTTARRPPEIQEHWEREYPEVACTSSKLAVLEQNAFQPIATFLLPARCWLENYYRPLQAGFAAFLERHDHSEAARDIVAETEEEIRLYETYGDVFGYVMYIARAVEPTL